MWVKKYKQAVDCKDLLGVALALEGVTDIDQFDEDLNWNTPLLYAMHRQNIDVIHILLDKNVKVNAPDKFGYTPLNRAADVATLQLLIDHGADVAEKDIFGDTILHWLCNTSADESEMIELAIKHGADLDCPNHNGYTPLHTAVMDANKEVVKTLLSFGASTSSCSNSGTSVRVEASYHSGMLNLLNMYDDVCVGGVPSCG